MKQRSLIAFRLLRSSVQALLGSLLLLGDDSLFLLDDGSNLEL